MASKTLSVGGFFADGVTVKAYLRSNWGTGVPLSGAPVGSEAGATGSISGGAVTVTGLADDTTYLLVGDVGGGTYRYLRFDTYRSKQPVSQTELATLQTEVDGDEADLVTAQAAQLADLTVVPDSARGGSVLSTTVNAGAMDLLLRPASLIATTNSSSAESALELKAADFAARAGKTAKLRARYLVLGNPTPAAVDLTVGLYAVTPTGGANTHLLTKGALVTGSDISILSAALIANAHLPQDTADFALPADGLYAWYAHTSASFAGGAALDVRAVLLAHRN